MYKVTIDSFDTEEEANAFTMWLESQCDKDYVTFFNGERDVSIIFDGYDTDSSTLTNKVVNVITVDVD
jgi:hypothetical protein